jgi:predicted ATP-dependent endonuclease of OLD family
VHITRLRIQNFRSIKDLTVGLGETTVFIGQNNSGKTALIDAVRIVLSRWEGAPNEMGRRYVVALKPKRSKP